MVTLSSKAPTASAPIEPFGVSGDFVLESGASFTAPEGAATFVGDFTNSGGTFEGNGGTVVLDGLSQEVSGDTTFANLTKSVEGEDTLTFGTGGTPRRSQAHCF